MELRSIGKNIRKYRVENKLRQEDLAEKAGLSINYVGALERGEKLPSLETFIVISNALGVSSDMLLCDVIDVGYTIKSSMFAKRLDALTADERARIFEVLDTMITHSEKAKT